MASPPPRAQSLAMPALWLLSARVIGFALSFAIPLLLVRRLTQTDYGIYKQLFLVLATATSILPIGFHMSAFYFLQRNRERAGQVVLNVFIFHGLVAAAGAIVIVVQPQLLSSILNDTGISPYIPLISLVVLLWTVSFPLEYIALANQEARLATAFIVATQVTNALLLAAAVLIFGSISGIIYALIIQGMIQLTFLVGYLHVRFKAFSRHFDSPLLRTQVAYAIPLGLSSVLWSMLMQAHHYFVSSHFGPAAYAIYAVGCFQVPLIGMLGNAVGSVMIPRVCALRNEGNTRQIIELIARMTKKLSLVYFPIYVFMVVVSREFVITLFTSRYEASWPILAVNLTLILLAIVGGAYDPIMRAFPEHRFFLLSVEASMLSVLVAILWIGTSGLGLLGVISVVVSVNAVERLVTGWKAARIVGATWRDVVLLRDVGKIGMASALAGLATAAVRWVLAGRGPLVVLVVGGVVFLCVYVWAAWAAGVVTRDEWRFAEQRVARLRRFVPRRGLAV